MTISVADLFKGREGLKKLQQIFRKVEGETKDLPGQEDILGQAEEDVE